ncbi:DUF7696 family protein [Ralstonia nicotianae]
MALDMTQLAAIRAGISALIHVRRPAYAGRPHGWRDFCEMAHVASLSEAARAAYLSQVAIQRGADTALHLKERAESLRAKVVQNLNSRSTPCIQSASLAASRIRGA